MALTMVIDSCGHETYGWPHLYEIDPDFSTTYQMLGANSVVANFHLQDGFLCRLGYLMCSIKRAREDDLGISLQSGGRTVWH
jgi:hypothetical protein